MKAATDSVQIRKFAHVISIHAAREGGDRRQRVRNHWRKLFQSTPPVKAATLYAWNQYDYVEISIHAAREGGDVFGTFTRIPDISFQSTPPVKAATAMEHRPQYQLSISIHAAREGGDLGFAGLNRLRSDFNPRRP